MARIEPAPRDNYVATYGEEPALHIPYYAHNPALTKALEDFGEATLAARTLPGRLIELLRLRVAFHNQCRSCMAMRYALGRDEGVDENLVCSLERPQEAADLTDAEKAALKYADLFATNHLAIDDAIYEELGAHFSHAEIIELVHFTSMYVGFGRLFATWAMTETLPERFRAEDADVTTPWGGGELIHL